MSQSASFSDLVDPTAEILADALGESAVAAATLEHCEDAAVVVRDAGDAARDMVAVLHSDTAEIVLPESSEIKACPETVVDVANAIALDELVAEESLVESIEEKACLEAAAEVTTSIAEAFGTENASAYDLSNCASATGTANEAAKMTVDHVMQGIQSMVVSKAEERAHSA